MSFSSTLKMALGICLLLQMILVESVGSGSYGIENMSNRVVLTKQAQFQGFLGPGNVRRNSMYQSDPYSFRSYGHPVVEIFKGIPYANPPLDTLRYESPAPYPFNSTEVYTANVIKTPCPRFVNETNESYSSRSPVHGLRKIIKNMEDCLYLDIYAPMNTRKDTAPQGLPVLVFANSQPEEAEDQFDGSSMAAIGNLIVISFRYRVGVLGFLQPGYTDEVRSNFGLWDQLAALQWIRENIKEFGGDENNVCLMASDLDASLAGVLAFSRMSQAYGGLFHRLILLNSSPFSPTSLHHRPLVTTVQLARTLGCPLHERDGELLACLRKRPVTQLLSAAQTIGVEDLEYPFAPGLDGTIVQHDLGSLSFGNVFSSSIKEILGRFDLLCGLGKGPVIPNAGRVMWQNIELDRFVAAAVKIVLKLDPGAKPSGNLKQDVIRAIRNEYGDSPFMRELISDFLVVNPMIQLLDAHAETGKNTFFYVSNDYDPLHKGKHSELSYIFTSQVYQWKYVDMGQPNLALHPFEVFISLIANFVRNGDPNVANPSEKASNNGRSWPRYRKSQGRYLNFGLEPILGSKYRRPQTDFWGQVFPAILKPFVRGSENDLPNELNNANPPFFGGGNRGFYPNMTHGIFPTGDSADSNQTTSSMTQSTVVLVGCLLLLLNFLCFMGLFYQRERLKKAEIQLRKRYLENEEQEEHQRRRNVITAQLDQAIELDSQDSGPYIARNPALFHQGHLNSSLRANTNTPTHHPQMQMPLSLDAMSETETDNGFGPDFLGPNYDPRTKVSRWMFQQNHDRPVSPEPMSMSMVPPSMPMHIDIRSLQRRPEGSNLLTMAVPEFVPILPYQTPFQPHFATGSDIPYADSRTTSPSVSNFAEAVRFQPHPPTPLGFNNLSNVNFNNNQRRNLHQNAPTLSPSPLPVEEFPKKNQNSGKTPNRSSIIIPLRNSIVIRELDPDDSVESSEPKLVPMKTGTLTRSVGVGSNYIGEGTPSVTSETNGDQVCQVNNNPPSTFSALVLPHKHGHGHGHGTVQKVTFADGL